ncbi:MAG TPA: TlpA family protein disulfide reductase [Acidimicrobiia bacterium]|nr:TlpA family protein disulfide reductase [Acidimicrobiia bacterium]
MTAHSNSKRIYRLLIGAVAALAAVVVAINLVTSDDPAPKELAPQFALPNFEGETVRLTDFRGQPLVLNYWASWCLPCLAEMPDFEAMYQKHGDEVAFLGINLADDPVGAEYVLNDTGITYPVAVDADASTFEALGGFGMPTTVFIDSEGYILEMYTGALTAEELDDRIERYFLEG